MTKTKISSICVLAIAVLSLVSITNSVSATLSDASLILDITYFGNYTPPGVSNPSNMSNSVFLGTDPVSFGTGQVVIPLIVNGSAIVDSDSTNNVPGLHIIRKNGYVLIATYGFGVDSSRESVKANFSLSNATISSIQNSTDHPYNNQGNGKCGVLEGNDKNSNPLDDEFTWSGNSGTLCSTTNVNSDNMKVYYTASQAIPNLNVSCSASPSAIQTGSSTSFLSSVTGGAGNYSYSWSGACNGSSSTCSQTFPSSGTYTSNLSVSSGTQTQTANCSVSVSQNCINNSYTHCSSDDLYWYSSCGVRQGIAQNCGSLGCQNGQCVTATNLNVSCSASPNPVNIGNTVTFYAAVTGGTGNYSYSWSGACSGSSSTCYNSFSSSGNNTAVVNVTSGNQTISSSCYATVNGNNNYINNINYLGCYGDDVYWLNSYGTKQYMYQQCGSDYCGEWNQTYCSGSGVYRQRTCYNRGCAGSSCYSSPYTQTELVQNCSSNQNCQNGTCLNNTVQCSTGQCCENGRIKPSSSICSSQAQTEYSCLGGNVVKRVNSRSQYCSGTSGLCTGSFGAWTNPTNWIVNDYCTANERCVVGYSQCQPTAIIQPSYYRYYTKTCSDSDIYWYDSLGQSQGKYKECQDQNSCTQDSCQSSACQNLLRCDGVTCAVGSEDYNKYCVTCGDGICSENEVCDKDCMQSGLIVAVVGKERGTNNQWSEDINVNSGREVELLVVVKNLSKNTSLDNAVITVNIPKGITYKGDLKIDGQIASSADIGQGVYVGNINPDSKKSLSFIGQIEDNSIVTGTVNSGNKTGTDTMSIEAEKESTAVAAVGMSALSLFFGKWYFWLLAIMLIFFAFFFVFKKIFIPAA